MHSEMDSNPRTILPKDVLRRREPGEGKLYAKEAPDPQILNLCDFLKTRLAEAQICHRDACKILGGKIEYIFIYM